MTPLPPTGQGEGLAFTRDGSAVLLTTEGEDAPVHRLPAAPLPEAAPSGAGSVPASSGSAWTLAAVGAAVVVAGGLLLRRGRRRR